MSQSRASDTVRRCFTVRGRVQQVGFRAATRSKALELGLSGYARNMSNGAVEVLALGPPDAVARLREWLARGPALARVDGVEEEAPGEFDGQGFEVR